MAVEPRSLRICIATHDIVGPIRNGGIGTAYYALAVALARGGHDVTVLYGLGQHCEQESIAHWRRHYRKLGIRFVPAPEYPDLDIRGSWAVRASYRAYLWLKAERFDVIHFHEWRGIGYFSLLAKSQGLAFGSSLICVGAHSPSFWHKEGMRETPTSTEEFETDFLERESVRFADVVWSPSRHMLDWMRSHDWPRPKRAFVKQYIMLDFLDRPVAPRSVRPVDELVFFGRLETRKGLDLFCDALDRLAAAGTLPKRVLFMGKIASVDGVDSAAYLKRRAAAWSTLKWRIESGFDRDRALAYLQQGRRLAILPSRVDNLPLTVLECLGAGIPFVSSDVGGIPEMVGKDDRARVLCPLDADRWARAIARVLRDGTRPARPAIPLEKTLESWLAWHQRTVAPAVPALTSAMPKVTVCVTHRNRPEYLRQALRSIERQTYSNLEVVVVDDGSDKKEALAYLASLAPRFEQRGWKVVRQANRYPGAARNNAARHATGKYLLFMDDDNVAKPHEVETLVRAIQASGADLVTCFLDVFHGDRAPARPGKGTFRWSFVGGCTAIGAVQNCFGDTNCLVKRRVFDAIGGFTEDFGVGFEDWEFLAKAVLRGYDVRVVPEALVWYRQTGRGVNSTTAFDKNHLRALRPYLETLAPEHRNLLLLAKQQSLSAAPQPTAAPAPAMPAAPVPQRLDHVRNVVVFGAGEGGRLAMRLAESCGWDIPYIVDNNQALWDQKAHGLPVKAPKALKRRDFDLILVASYAGRKPLFDQLNKMGFSHRRNYAFFLDPVRVGKVQHQVTL